MQHSRRRVELKVREFLGLIANFAEVTGETLVDLIFQIMILKEQKKKKKVKYLLTGIMKEKLGGEIMKYLLI